jgi:hypothetical protein
MRIPVEAEMRIHLVKILKIFLLRGVKTSATIATSKGRTYER